jgi:hypothetical protein
VSIASGDMVRKALAEISEINRRIAEVHTVAAQAMSVGGATRTFKSAPSHRPRQREHTRVAPLRGVSLRTDGRSNLFFVALRGFIIFYLLLAVKEEEDDSE